MKEGKDMSNLGMTQQIFISGRTTKDLKLNFTTTGTAVANFNLAVNRKNGNEADFIPCVIWGDQAKTHAEKIGKGSLIGVKGEFRSKFMEVGEITEPFLKLHVDEIIYYSLKKPNFQSQSEEDSQVE